MIITVIIESIKQLYIINNNNNENNLKTNNNNKNINTC